VLEPLSEHCIPVSVLYSWCRTSAIALGGVQRVQCSELYGKSGFKNEPPDVARIGATDARVGAVMAGPVDIN